MGSNRIQKLLFSEYSDLEDTVLIESPFAETDRLGQGLRQVQIGLTPTKLILAEYSVKATDDECVHGSLADPDIDSFELVCAYPVECVNLSVFRHRKRKSIKACFCNGKVNFFEIGGWHERKMLWSVWCERIKFLSPYESKTSVSETSVASSSSGSDSLYIVRSNYFPTASGKTLLWCHYSFSSTQTNCQGSWVDPHIYLGPSFHNKGFNDSTVFDLERRSLNSSPTCFPKRSLALSAEHEMLAREAVELWECQASPFRKRLRRLYGLTPFPGLLSGLGMWRVSRAESHSLQWGRSSSLVCLRDSCGGDCALLTSAQLVRTVSQEALDVPALSPDKLLSLAESTPTRKLLKFWTDGENQNCEYLAQQRRLKLLRNRSSSTVSLWKREAKKSKRKPRSKITATNSDHSSIYSFDSRLGGRHPGGGDADETSALQADKGQKQEEGLHKFTSSCLARQLTMIDKHLFQQLTTLELGRLRKDRSSCRTPQLRALQSFSHRVSCLVASQVISGTSPKERALRVLKCIGIAYNCHKLQSIQSVVSVMNGLQCPAVYRLQETWGYVRRHHATKFRRFVDLSKRYQDPRLPLYHRTFDILSQTPPYMPCVPLLVVALLRQVPEIPRVTSVKFSSEPCVSAPVPKRNTLPKSVRRFLSAFNIYSPEQDDSLSLSLSSSSKNSPRDVLLEDLQPFFAPTSECPSRRLLQDLDYFLEAGQAAAARYSIPLNPPAREHLLQAQYGTLPSLFFASKQCEPCSQYK